MKTYSGGCHCGAVAYEVDLQEPIKGMECNCSICSITGTVLAFAPASNFRLQKGEDDLTDYLFYKKTHTSFVLQTLRNPLFCSWRGSRWLTDLRRKPTLRERPRPQHGGKAVL